ncbi:hypothetical protein DH2020_045045 [Rehmannia glutinosa]|uniref:Glycosyltransferase N-terminal domain-containing protein n=1 Tax=Rehmannia glutinosa TaxID=99300 RepID=A0ABR0UFC4_REHGL
METAGKTQKPHAICVPFPAQGHINPMLKLAILLHHKGFHITFVHTEYNYNRLRKSRGGAALSPSPDFQFATIPDGLPPPENADSTQDIRSLCLSTEKNCLAPLNELIGKLNHRTSTAPPVSCIIGDMAMGFALDAAEGIGVPCVLLQTSSACNFMCYKHIIHLVDKGFVPLKDESYLKNGYMETLIDWIPGVIPIRLKEFSNNIRTTNPYDPMLNFLITEFGQSSKAAAIIINTFNALEQNVLTHLSSICPPIYTVGSLHLLLNQLPPNYTLKSMSSSLWKEDHACLNWLDSKPKNSVIYVNFGSITVLNTQQLSEFAWGLAESKKNFMWIIRPDLVQGENAALPPELWDEIGDRGFTAGWSPQEQNVNCRYACEEWGVGMVIGGNVKRDEVGFLVRELMDGEKGKMLKKRALEWKKKAAEAVGDCGSSSLNLDRLISEVLSV